MRQVAIIIRPNHVFHRIPRKTRWRHGDESLDSFLCTNEPCLISIRLCTTVLNYRSKRTTLRCCVEKYGITHEMMDHETHHMTHVMRYGIHRVTREMTSHVNYYRSEMTLRNGVSWYTIWLVTWSPGRAATERFSAQLPRAHWIGPE